MYFDKTTTWSPCEDLTTELTRNNYAIMILNSPINFSFHQEFVIRMWRQAKVRMTIDGGTERWQQWLTMNEQEFHNIPNPDLITGDMDSLSEEVLNHFTNGGTRVVVTPDQNETDYVKALIELSKYCSSQSIQLDNVYVLADTCGRFDQIMANINALFRSRDILKGIRIYQIASTSLTWLLDDGKHSIDIPQRLVENQDWCALIPIGSPCQVSTTGLKWDLPKVILTCAHAQIELKTDAAVIPLAHDLIYGILHSTLTAALSYIGGIRKDSDDSKLEFGALVSTSNTYGDSTVVTVNTSSPVIWSMSIDSLL